jgi:hypothetical protein
MQPFIWQKFKVVPGYTYRLSLLYSEKEMEAFMNVEHRNAYRKAEKDGLTCELTRDFALVKSVVLKTFERKNKGVDEGMMENILSRFANEQNSFAFVSRLNGTPVATAFCIMDTNTVYYLLGGYDPAHRHNGAGIQCIWNSIMYAKSLDRKVFDFEGSMLKEVEKFFRGFGPELVPYFTVQKAWFPLEVGLKFYRRHQF